MYGWCYAYAHDNRIEMYNGNENYNIFRGHYVLYSFQSVVFKFIVWLHVLYTFRVCDNSFPLADNAYVYTVCD